MKLHFHNKKVILTVFRSNKIIWYISSINNTVLTFITVTLKDLNQLTLCSSNMFLQLLIASIFVVKIIVHGWIMLIAYR